MYSRILILSLILVLTQSIQEEQFELISIPLHNEDELKVAIDSDYACSIYFLSTSNCEKCSLASAFYNMYAENMKNIVQTYHFNCDDVKNVQSYDKYPFCDPKIGQLPQILFYSPPAQKINPYTKQPMNPSASIYQGELNEKKLSEYAKKLLPNFSTNIKSVEELESFFANKEIPNKVFLVSNRPDTGVLFKGLTSRFRDRLEFSEIKQSSEETVQKLEEKCSIKIDKFPTIILLNDSKCKVYEDKSNFDKLVQFLDPFASEQKIERTKQQAPTQNNDEEEITQAQEINQLNFQKFEQQILQAHDMILINIYQSEPSKSFKDIQNKYGKIMQYYDFKVETSEQIQFAKETLKITTYPSLRFFPLTEIKKQKQNYLMKGDIVLKDFQSEINELTQDETIGVGEANLQMFIQSAFQENVTPVIMFYDSEQTPLSYRVISANTSLKQNLKFLSFKNPNINTMKQFGISKLPQMKLLLTDQNQEKNDKATVQIASFMGKINYESLWVFLSQFMGKSEQSNFNKVSVNEIKNQQDLNKYCIDKKSQVCYIAFFNGENRQQDSKFDQDLKVLQSLAKLVPTSFSFTFIDGVCHNYLLEKLNLSDDFLPQVVAYIPNKKIFINQIGTFELESLELFIKKAAKGQTIRNTLNEELQIKDIDCSQFWIQKQQSLQNNSNNNEDDEFMREYLEEQRLKQLEIEKQEKEERKAAKKNKKKKDL